MSYKDTVFLPKTDFSMKGDLAKKEPGLLKNWEKLYERLRVSSKDKEKFILMFGPPYANGHIHMGHALTYVLKDIINKTHQMLGYDSPMIPGWDSHGLPIEWKIEEQYRKKGMSKDDIKTTEQILEFRQNCRDFAKQWMDVQREELKRLGIVVDFEDPYNTMHFESEAEIVNQMNHFLLNGTLYQGLRPIMWSVVEQTALADNEVEYKNIKSPSIYVAFPVQGEDFSCVIWTTTPWTLPANRAICFNKDLEYVLIELTSSPSSRGTESRGDLLEDGHGLSGLAMTKRIIVAKECLDRFIGAVGQVYKVVRDIPSDELSKMKCHHPLYKHGYDFDVPLFHGDHVTLEAGTGLVHTAPGHGIEDFEIGKQHNIKVPHLIGDNGIYYEDVPLFAGEHVFKVGPKVMDAIEDEGYLMAKGEIEHSYPHSWRSKKPLIYRTTHQWFIDIKEIRKKALTEIEKVEWYPASGKNRIRSMVETRPDWCISRQRFWGTPLAIFMHKKTKEPLRDKAVQDRVVEAIKKEGGDAWYTKDISYFLGDKYNANDYEKVFDVLDVWFDSGCVHQFVTKKRFGRLADVVLEGSDQHRGWFQSLLLESVGIQDVAPYKKVVTHGFVLDEHGYKMSKSLGNSVSPQKIIEEHGADIIRQWAIFSDYTEDLRIGNEIIRRHQDLYRRFRNTFRYLLGALSDFKEEEIVEYKDMPDLEKYMLHLVSHLDHLHKECIADFKYSKFYEALHYFCTKELSSFYFDIRKDSLYCDASNDIKRRSTRTVMYYMLQILMRYLAPVLSFTTEEVYQSFTQQTEKSVHELGFFDIKIEWINKVVAKKIDHLREVRNVITGALEIERANKVIGSSLEAVVDLYVEGAIDLELLNEMTITSSIELSQSKDGFSLEEIANVYCKISKASGEKCERCWRVDPEVKTLCKRCSNVVGKSEHAAS